MMRLRKIATAAAMCIAGVGAFGAIAAIPPTAIAYEGEFCYSIILDTDNQCESNAESNIRRAIGHGSDYTFIEVTTNIGTKYSSCGSDGCTADSGYLSSDGTGHGLIENSGPNCSGGCSGDYYGYLYP